MPSRLTEVNVDCEDPERLAAFWSAVLGYERVTGDDDWIVIGPPGRDLSPEVLRAGPQPANIIFVVVPEGKMVKNRVHLDVTPVDVSQDDEVDHLRRVRAARNGDADPAHPVPPLIVPH